jgi:uncharacterized alpha-E superfamily protein
VLVTAERLENPARLLAAAAAQFRYHDRQGKARDNVVCVAAQQAFVGASQAIFRQRADDFEERGTYVIVQIF